MVNWCNRQSGFHEKKNRRKKFQKTCESVRKGFRSGPQTGQVCAYTLILLGHAVWIHAVCCLAVSWWSKQELLQKEGVNVCICSRNGTLTDVKVTHTIRFAGLENVKSTLWMAPLLLSPNNRHIFTFLLVRTTEQLVIQTPSILNEPQDFSREYLDLVYVLRVFFFSISVLVEFVDATRNCFLLNFLLSPFIDLNYRIESVFNEVLPEGPESSAKHWFSMAFSFAYWGFSEFSKSFY